MASYFITGATGFIGRGLVNRLVGLGHDVRCLTRNNSAEAPQDGRVRWIGGELNDPCCYRDALRDTDYVIHLAALLHARRSADYIRVNVGGTRALLQACVDSGAPLKGFVSMSSIAAMGPVGAGRLLTESGRCHPTTEYGKSKYLAEKTALEMERPFSITILRPSFVYGREDPRGADYIRSLLSGSVSLLFRVVQSISLCHVSDVVESCLCAVRNAGRKDGIFIISDPVAYRWDDIIGAIEKFMLARTEGKPTEAKQVQTMCRRARHMIRASGTGKTVSWGCDTRRSKEVLGFQSGTPLHDGIRDTMQGFLRKGWLPGIPGNQTSANHHLGMNRHEKTHQT